MFLAPAHRVGYHPEVVYQVLARSWRPQAFTDLLGQDAVVKTLQNALSTDTLGHAYLFSGLRGVGKTTVARLLSKAVNCEHGPTPNPCGECVSCREIATGASLDVVELDGASNRGIDDVRELRELLRYRPTRDRFRVIIIDEVHMLTREAFNALLKSLEEPPAHIIFVLATTERHKVPPTILSRCQQLEFRPVSSEAIATHLRQIAESEAFEMTPPAADMIARSAQGSVRDALSLLDQLRAFSGDRVDEDAVAEVLGVPRFEQSLALVEALAAGDVAAGMAVLREELAVGHDATVLFQETGHVIRTLLHLAVDPAVEAAVTDDQRERMLAVAQPLGLTPLSRMLGLWLEQEMLLREAASRELALEVACLRLARWPAVRELESALGVEVTPAGTPPAPAAGSPPFEPPTTPPEPTPEPTPEAQSDDGTPGERLAAALWPTRPRLAGAVECAAVTVTQKHVVLAFDSKHSGLAEFLDRPNSHQILVQTCHRLFGSDVEVNVEILGMGEDGEDLDLRTRALQDPTVQLAHRVLGGDVVAVRPDRETR